MAKAVSKFPAIARVRNDSSCDAIDIFTDSSWPDQTDGSLLCGEDGGVDALHLSGDPPGKQDTSEITSVTR